MQQAHQHHTWVFSSAPWQRAFTVRSSAKKLSRVSSPYSALSSPPFPTCRGYATVLPWMGWQSLEQ